jgi:hypothetical protein
MADKINWKGIPGLTVEVIKELTKLPANIAMKAFEGLSSASGSLADITADQVRSYRSTDQGDASRLSVQSGSEGGVQPTQQETFAGRPAAFPRDDSLRGSETFGAGFTPIQTERSTGKPPEAIAQERRVSPYTRSTALKDTEGNQLTEESLTSLNDADITERYTVFFGEKPKDAKVARSELLDLFKSFSKSVNPVLN